MIYIEGYKNYDPKYFPRKEYICPYCSYEMLEGEEDDTSDCGCPSCRRLIDWEWLEFEQYIEDL